MLKHLAIITFTIILSINQSFAQQNKISTRIDSLLNSTTEKPFNGIILISQDKKTIYKNKIGYSDIENKKALEYDDQFIVGSVSKQFTAVLILQEYEKGKIDLNAPISTFLPELTQDWANIVTVDHLLTHKHGIRELDKPLAFVPNSQYEYSQIGYDLLAKIVEKVTGKSFSYIAASLFNKCGMTKSCHPQLNKYNSLAIGYKESDNGNIVIDARSTEYTAAGGFISSVNDLLKWNKCLHEGRLLKKDTYKLMITKKEGAIRDHPVFGLTEYGYGITVSDQNGLLQLGQTGYAPGYVSMDFYFPQTKMTIIVLENIAYDIHNLKNTFYYHSNILDVVKDCLSK